MTHQVTPRANHKKNYSFNCIEDWTDSTTDKMIELDDEMMEFITKNLTLLLDSGMSQQDVAQIAIGYLTQSAAEVGEGVDVETSPDDGGIYGICNEVSRSEVSMKCQRQLRHFTGFFCIKVILSIIKFLNFHSTTC